MQTNVAKSTDKDATTNKLIGPPQKKGFLRDRIAKQNVDDIEQAELGKAGEESICDKDDLELLTTNEDAIDSIMFRESYFLTMTQNVSLDSSSSICDGANITQNPLTFESFAEVIGKISR